MLAGALAATIVDTFFNRDLRSHLLKRGFRHFVPLKLAGYLFEGIAYGAAGGVVGVPIGYLYRWIRRHHDLGTVLNGPGVGIAVGAIGAQTLLFYRLWTTDVTGPTGEPLSLRRRLSVMLHPMLASDRELVDKVAAERDSATSESRNLLGRRLDKLAKSICDDLPNARCPEGRVKWTAREASAYSDNPRDAHRIFLASAIRASGGHDSEWPVVRGVLQAVSSYYADTGKISEVLDHLEEQIPQRPHPRPHP